MLSRFLPSVLFFVSSLALAATDPLPSWNEGPNKTAIKEFVARVTNRLSTDYVAPADRIAVFDNDGTLITEQPLYFQLQYTIEQVQAKWEQHPDWNKNSVLVAIKNGQVDDVFTKGVAGANIAQAFMELSAVMTQDQAAAAAKNWMVTTKHPRYNRPYIELIYKPMRELLDYFKANGFKNFIVSGSGADFLRPWTNLAYGVPAERTIGTSSKLSLVEASDGTIELNTLAEINFLDDGPTKVMGIHYQIGRQPIFAAGNSDGDLQMLQWTSQGTKAHLQILIHHTDASREYAYDRNSRIGRLDKALDRATAKKWNVIDMKEDWKVIF